MMPQLTIMIEGQEGLTWEGWRRLAQTVEDAGYAGLFRSDHVTGLFGDPTRASLDCWASLTWLATNTQRLRFGPLVCPLTFHHPALLAKRAAARSGRCASSPRAPTSGTSRGSRWTSTTPRRRCLRGTAGRSGATRPRFDAPS